MRIIVRQWLGNLIVILLGLAWLQIPDSHVWQFLFSIVAGVAIVLAWLWVQATSFRIARFDTEPLWRRMLIVALLTALWCLLLWPIAVGRQHEGLFAGFWNSKLSAGMRYFFTYSRLVDWQDGFYDLLLWIAAGIVLPLAVPSARRAYRHWFYWVAVVVCGFTGTAITGALLKWMPGQGALSLETASVLLRLAIAYTIDILLWSFMVMLVEKLAPAPEFHSAAVPAAPPRQD